MNEPRMISRSELSERIHHKAGEIGFDLCGITPAIKPEGFEDLKKWLDKGHAGEMKYIENRLPAYGDPHQVLEGARSIIVLASNYPSNHSPDLENFEGRVSRYAWSETDYHDVLREKLKLLGDYIHELQPDCRTRGVVDSAPVLERDFAKQAGLGWFGKNTMLINKKEGSWFFISAILTDLELDPDQPHLTDHCGTCTRCLEVCPTDAFEAPYELNARKCISYLTIELKQPIPENLRPGMQDWIFGCDLCQDVCPWNKRIPENRTTFFESAEPLTSVDAIELLELNETEFRNRFRKTPLSRPGRKGILRNAAIILGNEANPRSIPVLSFSLNDKEPLIRGASAWALGMIGGPEALNALTAREYVEDDPEVLGEISRAKEKINNNLEFLNE